VQRACITHKQYVCSMETSYRNVLRTVHICPAGYVHRKTQKDLISQGVSECMNVHERTSTGVREQTQVRP